MTFASIAVPHGRRLPSWQFVVTTFLLCVILVGLWFVAPNFFRYQNLINVLLQTALLGTMALGMGVVMIVGGIDLSIPANMAMSAILGALLMKSTGDWVLGAIVMVLVGMVIGLINGLAVAVLKMIPFVVTLAMMTVVSGTAVWVTNSVSISQLPSAFVDTIGARPFLNVPLTVWFVALLAAVVGIMMRSSIAGRWAYAVGINERAAVIARVPILRVKLLTYVFSGLMAGIAAVLLTVRLGAASADMGNDAMVLDIVSACVVGGISIYGGAGRAPSALFGALLITLLSNTMNLVGVSFYLTLVIKGVVIIGYVAADGRRAVRQ